jgi:probable HAF family extracellular repeat protein
MKSSLSVLSAVSLIALSACGGGGGGSATIPTAPGQSQDGAAPKVAFPSHYVITDLGANAIPAAVNASGAVAGTINNRAFLSAGGATIIFGTLNGASDSGATDLNDNGIAVGTSGGHAAAFKPDGSIIDLGIVANNVFAFDLSINNSNQIVGLSAVSGVAGCGGNLTSFSFTAPPANIGPTALSVKINNGGIIAAAIYNQSGPACEGTIGPALFPSGTGLTVPSIFTLDSQAGAIVSDINDAGLVLGSSPTTSNETGTFVLQAGTNGTAILPIPGQNSIVGAGINSQGWVVGGFNAPSHAFAYANGKIVDLNSLLPASCAAWTLTDATDINDTGDIVGVGTLNGVAHGFLLTPQP